MLNWLLDSPISKIVCFKHLKRKRRLEVSIYYPSKRRYKNKNVRSVCVVCMCVRVCVCARVYVCVYVFDLS